MIFSKKATIESILDSASSIILLTKAKYTARLEKEKKKAWKKKRKLLNRIRKDIRKAAHQGLYYTYIKYDPDNIPGLISLMRSIEQYLPKIGYKVYNVSLTRVWCKMTISWEQDVLEQQDTVVEESRVPNKCYDK